MSAVSSAVILQLVVLDAVDEADKRTQVHHMQAGRWLETNEHGLMVGLSQSSGADRPRCLPRISAQGIASVSSSFDIKYGLVDNF
jgi:hypothetical protein